MPYMSSLDQIRGDPKGAPAHGALPQKCRNEDNKDEKIIPCTPSSGADLYMMQWEGMAPDEYARGCYTCPAGQQTGLYKTEWVGGMGG